MFKGAGWVSAPLLPLLFLLAAAFFHLQSLRSNYDDLAFIEDASYQQCQFARQIKLGALPGFNEDQPSPITSRGLYTLLLSAVYLVTDSMFVSVHLLALIFSLLALVLMYRIALLFELKNGVLHLALFLAVLHPMVGPVSWSANGDSLFVFLVLSSLCRYWSELKRERLGLTMGSMIPIAFAAAIHLEALTVLLCMGLGSFLTQVVGKRDVKNGVAALISVITGTLLSALCLTPAVGYHLLNFHMPWPVFPSPLDSVSGAAAHQLWMVGWSDNGFSHLFSHGAFIFPWPGLLTLAGVLAALALLFEGRRAVPLEFLALLCLPPLLAGGLIPLTGGEGQGVLAVSLAAPLMFFSVQLCLRALRAAHYKLGLPIRTWKGHSLYALGGGLFFLMIAFQGLGLSHLTRTKHLESLQVQREQVLKELDQGHGPLATDVPGWLAWKQAEKVIDIQGPYFVLNRARDLSSGGDSPGTLPAGTEALDVQGWVIWNKAAAAFLRERGMADFPEQGAEPRIMLQGRSVSL